MQRFILQLHALAPRCATVSRLEEPAGLIVAVRAYIQHARVARVNDDVVDEESGLAEVIKEPPVLACIRRSVNLAVERSKIETVRVVGIDYKGANVASLRAGRAPVVRIQCGIGCVSSRQADSGVRSQSKTEEESNDEGEKHRDSFHR